MVVVLVLAVLAGAVSWWAERADVRRDEEVLLLVDRLRKWL